MPKATYRKIVVPLDGSGWSEYAIPHAAAIARAHDAEVILLHICRPPAQDYVDALALAGQIEGAEQVSSQMAQKLTSLCHELRSQGVKAHAQLIHGTAVVDLLCDFIESEKADLVVMTTRGHTGLARALFGSTARAVLERVNVPVSLLQPSAEAPAQKE
ncbi:MAG: universal stress protein [Anaerolineae bacterium]|nr:universal stress protein [Anaerolineae bacterium]MDW8173002.1 universal stress protein [Anaerolineae bacterium]